jgi:diguanylate cyclase (GGDEF)-like protein
MVREVLNDLVPGLPTTSKSFHESAAAVLGFLAEKVPFGLWMVTRTEGEDWIVLSAVDRDYGINEGAVFTWSNSFWPAMKTELGPRDHSLSDKIPAHVEGLMGSHLPIESYMGVPIRRADGSPFGMLCAIDQGAQSPEVLKCEPLVEILASLLGTILAIELQTDSERRRAERAEAESMVDELTQLGNRRAWERTVEAEEARCARYGDPASVLVIDLDDLKLVNDSFGHGAGDKLLRSTAAAIQTAVREGDFAARIGGDEFAMLAVHANSEDAELIRDRVASALVKDGIHASVGVATRHPSDGLVNAVVLADTRMYREKHHRRAEASP